MGLDQRHQVSKPVHTDCQPIGKEKHGGWGHQDGGCPGHAPCTRQPIMRGGQKKTITGLDQQLADTDS